MNYETTHFFNSRGDISEEKKMSGISQDWEPVVIRKKAPTSAARKDEKAVNAARRSGAEIETVKKCIVSFLFSIYLSMNTLSCMYHLV